MVGQVITDRYELEELIGSGGMASVFRAHDRLLERKVALKILHEHYTEDEEYVERFRREARAVAQLSHPNIVTVIDRGEEDGRQFIVFEYVEGENLKELVQDQGALSVRDALEIALQVARALAFAHTNGLIHRDVKPQNVLMNGDGRAKVTDFGIARSLDVERGVTQTGTVLGTSNYIAPEQARGERVDAQSDVYSFGVVVFELLAGDVPFPGDSFVAVAMKHINEPPPDLRELREDVSPRLAAAVDRALAKEPGERWPSMQVFAEELEACLAEVEGGDVNATMVVSPPAGARPRRASSPRPRVWPLVLVFAGLAALGAIAWFALSGDSIGRGSGAAGSAPVALSGVTAYDPYGSGGEHDSEAPQATDSDPSTAWHTQGYRAGFRTLGKPGVGLVLQAPRPVELASLTVASSTPGYRAKIQAGASPSGPFRDISPQRTGGTSTTFPIQGPAARYYVVWITELPGATGGRVDITEVKARAR